MKLLYTAGALMISAHVFAMEFSKDNVCDSTIRISSTRTDDPNPVARLDLSKRACEIVDTTSDGKGMLVLTKIGFNSDAYYVVNPMGDAYKVPSGNYQIDPVPIGNSEPHGNGGSSYIPFGVDIKNKSKFEQIDGRWVFVSRSQGKAQQLTDPREARGDRFWTRVKVGLLGRDLCGNLVDFSELDRTIAEELNKPGIHIYVHDYLSQFTGIYALETEEAVELLRKRAEDNPATCAY